MILNPYLPRAASSGGTDGALQALIDRTIPAAAGDAAQIGDYAFYNCAALTSADFPNAVQIGEAAFYKCTALTSVSFPLAETIGANAFRGCSKLTGAKFEKAVSVGDYAFAENTLFQKVDFTEQVAIGEYAFASVLGLQTVILRAPALCTLSATAFSGSVRFPRAGKIYVPSALVEEYKAAENWSTYASLIVAIEDYPAVTG